MFTLVFLILGIISALIHLVITKSFHNTQRRLEIITLNLIVWTIGGTGLLAASGHIFMAEKIAREIGWPPGSPFQFEVGVSNLAFGVLGILCIWFRKQFWLATVIASAVFLLGDAYGHFVQMQRGDLAPYNTGILVYVGDIFIPLLNFILATMYYWKYVQNKKKK